jgi:hypothetical protein
VLHACTRTLPDCRILTPPEARKDISECHLADRAPADGAGPTGLILTPTGANLHPENETRMLSLTVRDDPLQTAGVLRSLADRASGAAPDLPDLAPWHALQAWLELAGRRQVTIPYAQELAALADSRAVRLRRDFGAVLNLIRAHAILQQATRQRDTRGRILATLAGLLRVAIEDGYLTNLQERKGRPARITLGDPLPEERAVLPRPDALTGEGGV